MSIDGDGRDKLVVCGMEYPTTIIKKLKQKGIQAELSFV
jgi:hypothetical protein